MSNWKFSQETKWKQKFFTNNEKEVANFLKTGTIVTNIICSYSKSLKFFQTAENGQISAISRKLLIKSRSQNIFERSKKNLNLR